MILLPYSGQQDVDQRFAVGVDPVIRAARDTQAVLQINIAHQPEVAEALADRVVLVNRGEVREEASDAEALRAFFRPLRKA